MKLSSCWPIATPRNPSLYISSGHLPNSSPPSLRYFDFCGNVLDAWGKTGGQQGEPLEMIVFCLSIHDLWGRTVAKHNQGACAVAYADDGYIKASSPLRSRCFRT